MPTLQGKAIRGSFPADLNYRMRTAGQFRERAGPRPDHMLLILRVRRPPGPRKCRGLLGGHDERC